MENLSHWLQHMHHFWLSLTAQHMHEFWLGLAVLLGILDVILGTSFFLIWLASASISVGILVWLIPSIGLSWQFFIFALGSITSTLLWRRYVKQNPTQSDRPHLNRRSEQYIGRTFTLTESIENGRGKIRVEDSIWQVTGPDLPAGTKIKVVGTLGIVLKVVPTKNEG